MAIFNIEIDDQNNDTQSIYKKLMFLTFFFLIFLRSSHIIWPENKTETCIF